MEKRTNKIIQFALRVISWIFKYEKMRMIAEKNILWQRILRFLKKCKAVGFAPSVGQNELLSEKYWKLNVFRNFIKLLVLVTIITTKQITFIEIELKFTTK